MVLENRAIGLALMGVGWWGDVGGDVADRVAGAGWLVLRLHQPYSPSTAEVRGGIRTVVTRSRAWPGCQDAT